MKLLSYHRKYLKLCIIVEGELVINPEVLMLESMQKESPRSFYMILGFNDLRRHRDPVDLHHGYIQDIILQPQMKCSVPAPEYVNTEHGARTHYAVFILPEHMWPEDFLELFRALWLSADGKSSRDANLWRLKFSRGDDSDRFLETPTDSQG